jgi:hypothetical protein
MLMAALALTVCIGRAHAQIVVPIEVMGVSSATQTVQVNVPASSSPINALQIQMSGLEYATQASVQINGKSWIALNNTTAQTDPVSASWGGIGGPIYNQLLTVNLASGAVKGGANATVSFRFNGTDGTSSGYRVLGFNFVRADGSLALPSSTFVLDDPTKWTPPLPDKADIAAGQSLWQSQTLRLSSLPGAPTISAHCGDCHTADGHDLKYFNFSNPTIIVRSMFHGLTLLQGQQVASYIRSLPGPAPGAPWNPPYQPGPGLDSQPIGSWAAGAGYDAVLPSDMAMIPYLFPNGINQTAIASTSYLNVREMPTDMPLPAWNQWLPRVHPMDTWGTAFTQDLFYKDYGTLIATLAKNQLQGTLNSYLQHGLVQALFAWEGEALRNFKVAHFDTIKSWTPALSEAVYSAGKWHMVKVWELMQQYALEGDGNLFYGNGPLTEPRTWCSASAFDTSPKALGIPEKKTGLGGSPQTQHYFADAWYQVQLTLNPGNGQLNAIHPIDWPYNYGVIRLSAAYTHQPTAMRVIEFMTKAMQETDNGLPPSKGETGWSPQGTDGIFVIAGDLQTWRGYSISLQGQLLTALLEVWLNKTASFSPSQYYAAGIANPTDVPNENVNVFGTKARWVDEVAWMVEVFREYGAANGECNAVCQWAQTVWPDFNWSSLEYGH